MSTILLGCKAFELEIGTEFSFDEGYNWTIVRTEPRYLADDDNKLKFLCSSEEKPGMGNWEEVVLEDWQHVLLEKNWKG